MVDPNYSALREFLYDEFSEPEIADLCQELGLSYERLPGTGQFGKTRSLLETVNREGRMRALLAKLRELRPQGFAALNLSAGMPTPDVEIDSGFTSQANVSRETQASPLQGKLPIPLLPTLLIGLIAVLLLFGFLLPRITGDSAAASIQVTQTANAAAQVAAPTLTSVPVVETPASPAIIVAETLTPAPAVADGVVVVSTKVIPVTSQPTIAVIGTPKPIAQGEAGSGESHPAAAALKDFNAKLPEFYRGEVTLDRLQLEWKGKAYQALTGFASRQLPTALKLGTAPRSTLDIAFEYVNQPTVIASNGDQHTVRSREYWTYANPASGIVSCDTRDYTYTVVAEGGGFVVTDFSSKIVKNGCR
jgi:hypothetical protein